MAWIQEAYDLIHDPNTICVACISHGKDSLAMLRAIKLLGLPLHRIITSDVWATQDIPADLPPMWEWKKEADKIIKELYSIDVEHICAMQKEKYPVSNERKAEVDAHAKEDLSQFVQVERERERMARGVSVTSQCSTENLQIRDNSLEKSKAFLSQKDLGVKSSSMKKLTYEDIFYRRFKESRKEGRKEGGAYGFATIKNPYCRGELKIVRVSDARRKLVHDLPQANHTDFRSPSDEDNGANSSSSFPKAPRARGAK